MLPREAGCCWDWNHSATISYFSAGKMDIFSFIRRAKALSLDGVKINMEGDHLGHLGDGSTEHLKDVKALCDELGLFIQ